MRVSDLHEKKQKNLRLDAATRDARRARRAQARAQSVCAVIVSYKNCIICKCTCDYDYKNIIELVDDLKF